ncbi:5-formyltetrahydrofolate cyclo-ligase [Candidatus Hamiltonella defensa]|nr:5-formyltetrahydrofolate cyclo-ligase [Candidatus Hamiltonella defensa]
MINFPLTEENLLLRQKIRSQMREHRRLLSEEKQRSAVQSVIQHVSIHEKISLAQHIGVFLSFDGEIPTQPLIEYLWQQNKKVYLPVVDPVLEAHLLFVPYHKSTPLIRNKWNIFEPPLEPTQVIPFEKLNILFVPLVAFDKNGQRLGMGGGFYDRTLQKAVSKGPYPIGLAHDCQRVKNFPIAQWDIPLPEIMTPSKIWQRPS